MVLYMPLSGVRTALCLLLDLLCRWPVGLVATRSGCFQLLVAQVSAAEMHCCLVLNLNSMACTGPHILVHSKAGHLPTQS